MLTREQIDQIVEEMKEDPHTAAVLVTGSYVYGKPTEVSDLDLRVITKDGSNYAEKERMRFGTRVELYANPAERIRAYFTEDRENGWGRCVHFWAHGKIVFDPQGIAAALQEEAQKIWSSGPHHGTWRPSEKHGVL